MGPSEVHALIAEVLDIDVSQVRGDLAFGEVSEWDSLNHVNLMLMLEKRLEIQIGPDEMVELTSVALIEEFAGGHGARSEQGPERGESRSWT